MCGEISNIRLNIDLCKNRDDVLGTFHSQTTKPKGGRGLLKFQSWRTFIDYVIMRWKSSLHSYKLKFENEFQEISRRGGWRGGGKSQNL